MKACSPKRFDGSEPGPVPTADATPVPLDAPRAENLFFPSKPAAATPTLQTIGTVAARLGKSRSRLKEVCREIGLEPIRPAGSAAWLFDEARIHKLQEEIVRRDREGTR